MDLVMLEIMEDLDRLDLLEPTVKVNPMPVAMLEVMGTVEVFHPVNQEAIRVVERLDHGVVAAVAVPQAVEGSRVDPLPSQSRRVSRRLEELED